MKINLKIHTGNHLLKTILGTVEYAFTGLRLDKKGLYVINYHGTQKPFLKNFQNQLDFFRKHFTFISPFQLTDFYEGKLTNGPYLLLTFDDGIKNNYHSATLLNEQGIFAYYFVIPVFIETPENRQKEYFIQHIRPLINTNIDLHEEDFKSLSWQETLKMAERGNAIGSHTLTHTLVAKNSTYEKSEQEIVASKKQIEAQLKNEITGFCSPNNTLESVGSKEMHLIKEHYIYHFTTIPGINRPLNGKLYIKRCNIESHWLLGAVKFAIGKWDLRRWKKANMDYLNVLSNK